MIRYYIIITVHSLGVQALFEECQVELYVRGMSSLTAAIAGSHHTAFERSVSQAFFFAVLMRPTL